jgi:hypothetical protein
MCARSWGCGSLTEFSYVSKYSLSSISNEQPFTSNPFFLSSVVNYFHSFFASSDWNCTTVEGDKPTASSRRWIRVYAPLSCIITIEKGCAGPWSEAVGIKMLPTKTIHPTLPKNRDVMLPLFLRLCRATDRFTHRNGVLGAFRQNMPTCSKTSSTAKTMVWRSDPMEVAHTSSNQNPAGNVWLPCRFSRQRSPR